MISKGINTAKLIGDNTNKIIMSLDFGGNKYSKNFSDST